MTDISSVAEVRRLLEEHGLKAKKSLGQNFLVDGNILRKMVDSLNLQAGDVVVEIGPGLGVLTRELAARGARVLAVETDRALIPVLEKNLAACAEGFRLLNSDIMQVDIENALEGAWGEPVGKFQVCANIPYHITSPIIFKLLEECPHMTAATLMMQKEVAARIMASPGGKDYGRLGIAVAYHCRVRHLMGVGRNCYYPRPDVDSAVLRFEPYREGKPCQASDEKGLFSFLAFAFQHRRKTLLNISSQFFGKDKGQMEEILAECGLEANLRPENLSLNDYVLLSNFIALRK